MRDEMHLLRTRIGLALPGARLESPATMEMIKAAEATLEVKLPCWLSDIYMASNGVRDAIGVRYLYTIDGEDGAAEFTRFLRREEWAPFWIKGAIIFGGNISSGMSTTHWISIDGQLASWSYEQGVEFTGHPEGLLELWRADYAQLHPSAQPQE